MIGAKFLTTESWSMRFVSELSITGFWAGTFRDTLQFAFSGFSKACVFFVIENASIDSRPHYRFDAFSTVRTETCEKNCTLWLKLNTMRMPQTRAPVIFYRFHFDTFSTRAPPRVFHHLYYCDMYAFSFWSTLRAFSNRCVCDENAQRISVDGRPKRMEMAAFSYENALVWVV